MYGRMLMTFVKKYTDPGFVKQTRSLFFVACTFAAWQCQQAVPLLNDHRWFDSVKRKYEARCQVQNNNLKKNTSSKVGKNTKKGQDDEKDESNIINPSENEIRIVVIGANEHAKSTTASMLLLKDNITWCHNKETKLKTLYQQIDSHKYKIDIIDTSPVFEYPPRLDDEKKLEIHNATALSCPGPHAVILCIPTTNIDNEHLKDVIKPYENIFGNEIYDFVIVAFTHYEKFDSDDTGKSRLDEEHKKDRFYIGLENAIKKNNVMAKIKNVRNNHILVNTQIESNDKFEILNQVLAIIRERESMTEHKQLSFARSDLSKQAETLLQEIIKRPEPENKNTAVTGHPVRRTDKKPKANSHKSSIGKTKDTTPDKNSKAGVNVSSKDTTPKDTSTRANEIKRDTVKKSKHFLDEFAKQTRQ
ncbi:GTPase IMAP family member 9-like [Mytilus californianus]|uniref:GTPase IMAP family member 9-like n=1 Tax=Mytilus californianus TaxID=6549 RepID=UPI002246FE93|nr:GTPase IMAP family member 9-like [Mytilus californianus]